jgi:hypothetical protein
MLLGDQPEPLDQAGGVGVGLFAGSFGKRGADQGVGATAFDGQAGHGFAKLAASVVPAARRAS